MEGKVRIYFGMPGVAMVSRGALLRSPTWLQIMANVLDRPVVASGVQEVSARGAAMLALESLGVVEGLRRLPDFVGRVYRPDSGRHTRYREAIHRQEDLYEKLVLGEMSDGRAGPEQY